MTIMAQCNGEYGPGRDMASRRSENRDSENGNNENLDDPNNVGSETTTSAAFNNNSKTVRSPTGVAHSAPLLETTNSMMITSLPLQHAE